MNKKINKQNLILMLLVVLIVVTPLVLNKDSEFAGADGLAEEAILEIDKNYEPWMESLIEPPGGETESLLFALQAALGSGVIFYIIGYLKASHKKDTVQ